MAVIMFRAIALVLTVGLVGACTGTSKSTANHENPTGSPVQDSGVLGNSPYRVDIPAKWNGQLVMLLHGYEPKGIPRESPWPQNDATPVFLADGFAVAQSAYASQGWAVTDAISDNEQLRAYFWRKYGKPRQTYLVGFSLGGHVAIASLEQHGTYYDGALSLCGINAPTTRVFDDVLTSLVAFDYFFQNAPGLPGSISDPESSPKGQVAVMEAVEAALKSDEASVRRRQKRHEVSV